MLKLELAEDCPAACCAEQCLRFPTRHRIDTQTHTHILSLFLSVLRSFSLFRCLSLAFSRARKRERDSERERKSAIQRERERECVYVFACLCDGELGSADIVQHSMRQGSLRLIPTLTSSSQWRVDLWAPNQLTLHTKSKL